MGGHFAGSARAVVPRSVKQKIASLVVTEAPEAPWEEVGVCAFHMWMAVPRV